MERIADSVEELLTNKEKNEFLAKHASRKYDHIDEDTNNISSNETFEEEINRGEETTEQQKNRKSCGI